MSEVQATTSSKDLDAGLKAVEDCTKGLIEKVKTPAENARTGKKGLFFSCFLLGFGLLTQNSTITIIPIITLS